MSRSAPLVLMVPLVHKMDSQLIHLVSCLIVISLPVAVPSNCAMIEVGQDHGQVLMHWMGAFLRRLEVAVAVVHQSINPSSNC